MTHTLKHTHTHTHKCTPTDNSDYVPLSEVIVGFPADSSIMNGDSVCQTITIIGDDILEGDESFTVSMTPENDLDEIVGPASLTITIEADNDGKHNSNVKLFANTLASMDGLVYVQPVCVHLLAR